MSVACLGAAERETTITVTDEDDVVRIWTAQRRVITALRKRANATETASGFYGSTEWAAFVVPVGRFNLAGAVKATRPPKTAAQLATLDKARGRSVAPTVNDDDGLRRESTEGAFGVSAVGPRPIDFSDARNTSVSGAAA